MSTISLKLPYQFDFITRQNVINLYVNDLQIGSWIDKLLSKTHSISIESRTVWPRRPSSAVRPVASWSLTAEEGLCGWNVLFSIDVICSRVCRFSYRDVVMSLYNINTNWWLAKCPYGLYIILLMCGQCGIDYWTFCVFHIGMKLWIHHNIYTAS